MEIQALYFISHKGKHDWWDSSPGQGIYWECRVMCFTNKLTSKTPDTSMDIAGFTSVRADRDAMKSGKRVDNLLCIYFSYLIVTLDILLLKEVICCWDIELIGVCCWSPIRMTLRRTHNAYRLPQQYGHHCACLTHALFTKEQALDYQWSQTSTELEEEGF